ncbi:hypothetical protein [uncultured Sunxiuqinia sp.]|uniref:hypothetical protein n=1 Tax=uncultured Sunxiuqinia sp. TaxID=1573825 RepID=UPI002AA6344A|nr:hypothetical protein [uncultured Sunxiuqinia sp.]
MSNKKNTLVLTGAGFSSPIMKYKEYCLNSAFLTNLLCKVDFVEKLYHEIYDSSPTNNFIVLSKLANTLFNQLKENQKNNNSDYEPNFEQVFYLLENIINLSNKNSYLLNTICELKSNYSDYNLSQNDLYLFQEFMLDVISLFKSSDEHLAILSKYFSEIMNNSYLQYYTLNYDSLIIDILSNINNKFGNLEITKNFNLGCNMAGGGFSGLTSQTSCPHSCGSDTISFRNPARPHTSDRCVQFKQID